MLNGTFSPCSLMSQRDIMDRMDRSDRVDNERESTYQQSIFIELKHPS